MGSVGRYRGERGGSGRGELFQVRGSMMFTGRVMILGMGRVRKMERKGEEEKEEEEEEETEVMESNQVGSIKKIRECDLRDDEDEATSMASH